MRAKADKDGIDMLLIDTGDRIEGNGLYDGSNPKGEYTFDIFKQQDIDVICSGNHELYKQNSSYDEFYKTVPNFKGSYLASNLDIYNPETGELEPLAPRFKFFKTKNQGIRIAAFGFLYNFQGNANNTVVKAVQDVIQEQWFQDVIRDCDVDLFLVAGHVGIRSDEFDIIYRAIRDIQWHTPIQFFGGHTHIRDFKKYDEASYAIESGRYLETIGFMSIDGLRTGKTDVEVSQASLAFRRRYIDNNLYSFHNHTSLNGSTFPTALGKNVSAQIAHDRKILGLDHIYGCAPIDLWVNRAEVSSSNSVFTWLGREVLPNKLTENGKAKIVISNTGAMRFDIFKGPFTRDTTFLVSPFTSGFRYIKCVNYGVAKKLLEVLNKNAQTLQDINPTLNSIPLSSPEQLQVARSILAWENKLTSSNLDQVPLTGKSSLTPGYTTKDDGGEDGDDTVHSQIMYYQVPNCIQTQIDFPKDYEKLATVDVVYNEFIEPWIITALQFLGHEYDRKDTSTYLEGRSLTDIISEWVEENWPCRTETMDTHQ